MLKRTLIFTLIAALLCGTAYASLNLDGTDPEEIETGEGFINIMPLSVEAEAPQTHTITDLGNDIYRITDATEHNPAGVQVDDDGAFISENFATDIYLVLGDDSYILYGCGHTSPYALPDLSELTDTRALYTLPDESYGGFDLGGRPFEFYGTDGAVLLVDVDNSVIFTGDAVGCGDGVFASDLNALAKRLELCDVVLTSTMESPTVYTAHSWQADEEFAINHDYILELQALLADIANGDYEALYTIERDGFDLRIGTGAVSIITTRRAALSFTLEMGGYLPTPFADAPLEMQYSEYVAWLYAVGLTNGTGPDTYEPTAGLTRAEFMTFLGRAADAEVDSTQNGDFIDVPTGEWYSGYIAWGVEQELIQGVGGNRFNPEGVLLRSHVNIIVKDRYAPQLGIEVGDLYTDSLNQPATRAEVAAVLYVLFGDAE